MKGANTYLTFNGNCREAMTFYKKCLGGDLELMSFADVPKGECDVPPEAKDKIMHGMLKSGQVILMASDPMPGVSVRQGDNFSIAIMCESLEEIEALYAALSENGTATMPLSNTFWGARFGMLTDQFGIPWLFNYELPK